MGDIPDDVKQASYSVLKDLNAWNAGYPMPGDDEEDIQVIARAILAERERCARVADADDGLAYAINMPAGLNIARRIAAAIRKGEPT